MKGVITISAVNLLKWNIPPWKDLNCWTKEELRNQCFFSHLPLKLTSDYKSRFGVCASICGCHTEKHCTLSSDDSVFHYFKIVSPKAGMYQQKWKRKNENKETLCHKFCCIPSGRQAFTLSIIVVALLTCVTPFPTPARSTGANIWSHAFSSIHAHRFTDALRFK